MTLNQKPTGMASSIPRGLVISGLIGVITTLIGAAIVAYLVDKELLDELKIGYAIMVMLLLASYLSALTAWKKIKHRRIIVCLSAGGVYFGILLSITALFFGGQYQAVGETAMLVLCGSMLAAMSGLKGKSSSKYRRVKNAYR